MTPAPSSGAFYLVTGLLGGLMLLLAVASVAMLLQVIRMA